MFLLLVSIVIATELNVTGASLLIVFVVARRDKAKFESSLPALAFASTLGEGEASVIAFAGHLVAVG